MKNLNRINELRTIVKETETYTADGRQVIANSCKELYILIEGFLYEKYGEKAIGDAYSELINGDFAEAYHCERIKGEFDLYARMYVNNAPIIDGVDNDIHDDNDIKENAIKLIKNSEYLAKMVSMSVSEILDCQIATTIAKVSSDSDKDKAGRTGEMAIKMLKDIEEEQVAIEVIELATARELKGYAASDRANMIEINGIELSERYPILELSNKHAMYYSEEHQSIMPIVPPFRIVRKK